MTVYTTDADLGCTRLENVHNTTEVDGLSVRYFRNVNNHLASRYRTFLPLGIASSMKQETAHYDIMHLHDFRNVLNVAVHRHARKSGTNYVLQPHGSIPRIVDRRSQKKLFDWLWGRRILEDASKIIALTNIEAKQLEDMGVNGKKIEIIPNGIDVSGYEKLPKKGEFRRKYSIGDGEDLVLYIGRLHRIKGIDILVKAFRSVYEDSRNARLAIVGPDDGYLATLERQIRKLEIGSRVSITGPLYEGDKLEAYVDADVCVLPSFYETFPLTVLEACACGTPVVATNRCGISHLVEKVGYSVEYNENQLRDAIRKILRDKELKERLGEEGKRLVRGQFSWNRVSEKIEDLYLDVLA